MRQVHFPPSTFPILQTQNLRLRELVPADADAVFRIFSDEGVTRTLELEPFTNINQAAELIDRQSTRFGNGEAVRWGIAQLANDVLIGTVGLFVSQSSATGGLGYDLASSYWRRGIMSEALGIVIRFAFRSVNLNRLQALVMPGNIASVRLLATLDFTEEGTLREYMFFKGKYQDLISFSLLQREFEPKDN